MIKVLQVLFLILLVVSTGQAQIIFSGNVSVSGTVAGTILPSGFQGFGAVATGGSTPCHVSNASQLTTCLASSGKHIIFDAGGTYNGTQFNIPSNTFIDCFSAPSAVLFTGGAGSGGILALSNNVSNIIIQGCRIRGPGPGNTKGIMFFASDDNVVPFNIVIDHCEISNVSDEDVGSAAHDVTLSWNLLGGPADSGGTLVKYGGYRWSIHHNFWSGLSGTDTRIPLVWAGNDSTANFSWNGQTIADVVSNISGPGWQYGITYIDDRTLANTSNVIDNFQGNADVTPDHCKNALLILPNPVEKHYIAGNANTCNPVNPNASAGQAAYGTTAEGDSGSINNVDSNKLTCPANNTGCQPSTPFPMPTITHADVCDVTARIAEWNSVIAQAGVISKFADDSTAAALRAHVTVPTTTIMNLAWNKQTGTCP